MHATVCKRGTTTCTGRDQTQLKKLQVVKIAVQESMVILDAVKLAFPQSNLWGMECTASQTTTPQVVADTERHHLIGHSEGHGVRFGKRLTMSVGV